MKGFTIVELLVAMAITLVIAAATLSLVGPAHDAFQVQPETADLQQRVRVGIDTLQRDLLMAGAGMYAAGTMGPLHQALAPVMPYRAFGPTSDASRGAYFRPDAISLLFVPSTTSQTALAAPLSAGVLGITIEIPPNCLIADAATACGFAAGDQVLLFDPAGEWEVFTVDRVAAVNELQLKGSPPARTFRMRANVTRAEAVTYALKPDPASGAFQLVRAEGDDPAQPVLDHVVKLEFQYFGAAEPPRVLDETEARPRSSYGPAPPPLEEPLPPWPPRENCTFTFVDGHYQSRLAALGSPGSQVELSAAQLTDGPWCPDADARNRFDADLLRIRRVHFTLRVQTALALLRGPRRSVPDLEIQFDVAPRNLNLSIARLER